MARLLRFMMIYHIKDIVMFYSLQPLKLPDRLGDVILFPNRKAFPVVKRPAACSSRSLKWLKRNGAGKQVRKSMDLGV